MTIDREELRRLCEAASPAPWGVKHHPGEFGIYSSDVSRLNGYLGGFTLGGSKERNDAAFIAAARTAVPELLGALEAAEKKVESLEVLGVLTRVHAYRAGLRRAAEIARATTDAPDEWAGTVAAIERAILAEASREEEKGRRK